MVVIFTAGALPNFIGFNFLTVAAAAAPSMFTVYNPNTGSYIATDL